MQITTAQQSVVALNKIERKTVSRVKVELLGSQSIRLMRKDGFSCSLEMNMEN